MIAKIKIKNACFIYESHQSHEHLFRDQSEFDQLYESEILPIAIEFYVNKGVIWKSYMKFVARLLRLMLKNC